MNKSNKVHEVVTHNAIQDVIGSATYIFMRIATCNVKTNSHELAKTESALTIQTHREKAIILPLQQIKFVLRKRTFGRSYCSA